MLFDNLVDLVFSLCSESCSDVGKLEIVSVAFTSDC